MFPSHDRGGCAWKSSVLQLEEGVYQVSANASPARGGETGAREIALTKANDHCETLGTAITTTDIETGYAFPSNSVVTVTFECQ